jgi:hypothetical protein
LSAAAERNGSFNSQHRSPRDFRYRQTAAPERANASFMLRGTLNLSRVGQTSAVVERQGWLPASALTAVLARR